MATVFSSQAGTGLPVSGPDAGSLTRNRDRERYDHGRLLPFCAGKSRPPEDLGRSATFWCSPKSNVARFLSRSHSKCRDGFSGGSATVSCDQQVSVIGLQFAGAIFYDSATHCPLHDRGIAHPSSRPTPALVRAGLLGPTGLWLRGAAQFVPAEQPEWPDDPDYGAGPHDGRACRLRSRSSAAAGVGGHIPPRDSVPDDRVCRRPAVGRIADDRE